MSAAAAAARRLAASDDPESCCFCASSASFCRDCSTCSAAFFAASRAASSEVACPELFASELAWLIALSVSAMASFADFSPARNMISTASFSSCAAFAAGPRAIGTSSVSSWVSEALDSSCAFPRWSMISASNGGGAALSREAIRWLTCAWRSTKEPSKRFGLAGRPSGIGVGGGRLRPGSEAESFVWSRSDERRCCSLASSSRVPACVS